MAISTVTDALKGKTVSFLSKRPDDAILYEGIIEGTVTKNIALGYFDIQSYNEAVVQADTTVPSNLDNLTFFLITITNTASPTGKETIAFANEWLKSGTLQLLDQSVQHTVLVYDTIDGDPSKIIQLLIDGGYKATIQSSTGT